MGKYVIRKGIHYGTVDEIVHRIEELEAQLATARADALQEAAVIPPLDTESDDTLR